MNYQDFFNELIKRWSAEKPEFFKTLQNISIGVLLVTGIPAALSKFGVDINFIPLWVNASLSLLSAGATMITQLTVSTAEKLRLMID